MSLTQAELLSLAPNENELQTAADERCAIYGYTPDFDALYNYETYKANQDVPPRSDPSLSSVPIFSLHSHVRNSPDFYYMPPEPFNASFYTSIPSHSTDVSDPQPQPAFAAAKRKYKPVAKKVKPVLVPLPSEFRIIRNITGDPLTDLPDLPTHPLPFVPTGRYTAERKDLIDENHPGNFLWEEK
ncbi:hypothetical protein C8Q76DRAFT_792297 [Earliella scabrosa]|nr:hypothetical protein C8Q76DRAFT_792297 [Earliella scabrosa]